MTIRRCAAALGAVVVGLSALSACSKPTPLATVTVGDNSVHTQAACYRDGNVLTTGAVRTCTGGKTGTTIKIKSFQNFHIGVDTAISDKGWYLFTNGQRVTDVMKDTYRTFGGAQLFQNSATGASAKSAVLDLVETSDGTTNKVTGVWRFKLELDN